MTVNICGHALELNTNIINRFSQHTSAPIERYTELFLRSDFSEKTFEEIFENHSVEKIEKTINQCFIDEIYLREGDNVYLFLDSIGYADYRKI